MAESRDQSPIFSELAGDPDLQELVEEFVAELPSKAAAMQQFLIEGDMDMLIRLAHQLKGSAGGYGFRVITDAAKRIEQTAQTSGDLELLTRQLREIAELCHRATAAAPRE